MFSLPKWSMPDYPRKPLAYPVAPDRGYSNDELNRKLAQYLDRAPEEKEAVQRAFTRVLSEVTDLKEHVNAIREENVDELRGIKARINVLEGELVRLKGLGAIESKPIRTDSMPPGTVISKGVTVSDTGSFKVDPRQWEQFAREWEKLKSALDGEKLAKEKAQQEENVAKAKLEGETLAKAKLRRDLILLLKVAGPILTALGAGAYHLITHFL